MADWIAIEEWSECVRLQRPGIVFEIRNGEDQRLVTPCVLPLPAPPFDWSSPPLEFRPVPEAPATHSAPIPEPQPR